MLGIRDAAHEETVPHASRPLISKLSCSLAGETETVRIVPGTLARRAYGRGSAAERFRCSYGLNPAYRGRVEESDLRVAGVGPDGEVRVVELPDHPFFVATLFLPQLSSRPGMPHPLIVAFLKAAIRECDEKRTTVWTTSS